jgi:hypothetical protein
VGRSQPLLDGGDEQARIGTRDGQIAALVAENAAGIAEAWIFVAARM